MVTTKKHCAPPAVRRDTRSTPSRLASCAKRTKSLWSTSVVGTEASNGFCNGQQLFRGLREFLCDVLVICFRYNFVVQFMNYVLLNLETAAMPDEVQFSRVTLCYPTDVLDTWYSSTWYQICVQATSCYFYGNSLVQFDLQSLFTYFCTEKVVRILGLSYSGTLSCT